MAVIIKLIFCSLRTEKSLHAFSLTAAVISSGLLMFFLTRTPDAPSLHKRHSSFGTFSFGFGAGTGTYKSMEAGKIENKESSPILFSREIRAMSVFIAMASFFILFATQFMALQKRRRQLFSLKALGMSRRCTFAFLMLESAALAGIGGTAGTLLGTIFACIDGYNFPAALNTGHFQAICFFPPACTAVSMEMSAIIPALTASIDKQIDSKKLFSSETNARACIAGGIIGTLLLIAMPFLCSMPSFGTNTKLFLFSAGGIIFMPAGLALLTPGMVMTGEAIATPAAAYFLGIPHLAIKHCASTKQWRTWLVTLSMSLGLGLYTALHIWCSSMLDMFKIPGIVPDMIVRFHDGLSGADTEKILTTCPYIVPDSINKAAVAQPELDGSVAAKMKKANSLMGNAVAMGILNPSNSMLNLMEYTEGSKKDVLDGFKNNSNICIIPDTLAFHCNLTTGDTLRLKKKDFPEAFAEYKIAAVVKFPWIWFSKYSGIRIKYPRTSALIFVPYDSAVKTLNAIENTFFLFNIEKEAPQEEIKKYFRIEASRLARSGQNIRKAYSGGIRHGSGINKYFIQISSRDEMNHILFNRADSVIDSMSAMPWTILIFTVSSLVCAMSSSVISRQKEFAVLRAMGASESMIAKSVLAEAVIIGFCACLLSLAAGSIYGAAACLMVDCSPVFGVTAPDMNFPTGKIIPGYLATMGLSTVTGMFFSRKNNTAAHKTNKIT